MQRIYPYLYYEDVPAAAAFLAEAFGLRPANTVGVDHGHVEHSHIEMELDDGSRVRMNTAGEGYLSPRAISHPTSMVQVDVTDIETHFARAKAAGATIVTELMVNSHGDLRYVADDLEGQRWCFTKIRPNPPSP
jgi:PhnB protein